MAPSIRQIQVYQIHKQACIANGHGQTTLRTRVLEGTLTTTALGGLDFYEPPPRTTDNPNLGSVAVWMTWIPRRLVGTSDTAGDNAMGRAWLFRGIGQCPAIDDDGNQITVQDEMFGTDPQGHRFRIENPILSADNSFWYFELVRHR